MIEIKIAHGSHLVVALIDDEDQPLAVIDWEVKKSTHGKFYVRRRRWKRSTLYLHREVMRAILGAYPTQEVDHRNGNPLDCRRSNLRLATREQQLQNAARPSHNTSGFKGVSKRGRRWGAWIKSRRRSINLGSYDTREEAALAYDRAAMELFGEFARLNFPRAA